MPNLDLYDATDKVKRVARLWNIQVDGKLLDTKSQAYLEGNAPGAYHTRVKRWAKAYPEWFAPRKPGDEFISLI